MAEQSRKRWAAPSSWERPCGREFYEAMNGAAPPIVHLVAGTRPNFVKIAPLYHVIRDADWCSVRIVHTGQHYDIRMSSQFFDDFDLPPPDHFLECGSGTHGAQTATVLERYEALCMSERPTWTIVAGDVNSTLAAALAAAKLGIAVAHLEAGLRSGDRRMPEEVNRILTDQLADLLWTPSPDADVNLAGEGVPSQRIDRVGNIMIDTLEMMRPRIEADTTRGDMGLGTGEYGIATLHRPSNVDESERLHAIAEQLVEIARHMPLVFAVHPRTRARLSAIGFEPPKNARLLIVEPMGYIAFMSLVRSAGVVVTDSGGLQEETSYLGIPCLTLRENTERPITIERGTNRLVSQPDLARSVLAAASGPPPAPARIDLWDGHTAPRVAASLKRYFGLARRPVGQ